MGSAISRASDPPPSSTVNASPGSASVVLSEKKKSENLHYTNLSGFDRYQEIHREADGEHFDFLRSKQHFLNPYTFILNCVLDSSFSWLILHVLLYICNWSKFRSMKVIFFINQSILVTKYVLVTTFFGIWIRFSDTDANLFWGAEDHARQQTKRKIRSLEQVLFKFVN